MSGMLAQLAQTASSDRRAGIVFLVVLLVASAVWWAIMRRRQQWWWGFERRPGDNTNERWIRANDARADKPMPERRIAVQRHRRRR
jgi:hypothetical protein